MDIGITLKGMVCPMNEFEDLRRAIAARHNIELGPDDPLLVAVSLNELMLDRYIGILTARNEAHQKALAGALQAQIVQSKETAGRVITEAADYVSDQVRKAAAEALADAAAQLQQDVQAARTTAIVVAVVAGFCALVAVAMAVIVLTR